MSVGRTLDFFDGIKLLKKYKIPFVKTFLAKNLRECVEYGKKVGFPLVLKIISPSIIHKTEVRGVIKGIRNEKELRESYLILIQRIKKRYKDIKIDGVAVQPLIKGLELIIGGKEDPQFGKVLMFGLGGIFVEVFEDVSFRVCPVSRKDIKEMIREIKGYKILKGYRGKAYDFKFLEKVLLRTSKLLVENEKIKELDINPFFLFKKKGKAVDIRVLVK